MRKIRLILVAAVFGFWGLLGTMAPAQAFTCNVSNPNVDDGGLICQVVYTATGPVCHKFGCM